MLNVAYVPSQNQPLLIYIQVTQTRGAEESKRDNLGT